MSKGFYEILLGFLHTFCMMKLKLLITCSSCLIKCLNENKIFYFEIYLSGMLPLSLKSLLHVQQDCDLLLIGFEEVI